MRYILQALTMAGDLATWGVSALAIWASGLHPIVILLAAIVLVRWYKTGNIEAWRPFKIRQFLKNAKEYGL